MNERLEQLAVEAKELAEQAFREDNAKRFTVMEKFAELIVEECRENFSKVWYEQGMDIRGAELGKFLTRFDEYIGVEE